MGHGQGSFNAAYGGSQTDRSWTGNQSATWSFDASGELVMELTGSVTVGPMPQAVNNTNTIKGTGVAPCFYGGPITLADGTVMCTPCVWVIRQNGPMFRPTLDRFCNFIFPGFFGVKLILIN